MGFNRILNSATNFAKKNGYIILGIGAIAGFAGSLILTYRMRPKVDKIMKEKKKKVSDIDESNAPDEVKSEQRKEVTKETLKELAPVVAPLATCAIVTAGCMGGTIAMAARRIDDLVSIARAGDIAYNNLYQSTQEVVGEEKANEIKMTATQKEAKEAGITADSDQPELSTDGFIKTGKGDTPFYDALTGRPFLCDLAVIEKAIDELNIELLKMPERDRRMPYNRYGQAIGLPYSILAEGKCWPDVIILNSANALPWGNKSVRVIDFVQRPILVI